MYECFHCLQKAVLWGSDFTFEDFGFEGEGIIHVCHCTNCGAYIEYHISIDDEGEEEVKNGETETVIPMG